MLLFNPKAKYGGTYFGNYDLHPRPEKVVQVIMSKKGVKIIWGYHGNNTLTWDEIVSFDFEGQVSNGVFKTTLVTTHGNLELESSSLHVQKYEYQQMRANEKRIKLNKVKRFVITHTASDALAHAIS
jgi:hypothetical protein